MEPLKNPTNWVPTSGNGYLVNEGVSAISDQNDYYITDQNGDVITDSGYQYNPKHQTIWTPTG